MIRNTLLALALVASLAGAGHAVAGPFLNRPTPPSAAELGLDATQAAQWQAIQADARALHQDMLMQVKLELAETREALAEPDVDLRAIGQNYQSIALTVLMEQRQLRDRRLAFYNGLDPQQQAQVRAFLIEVTERAERAIRAFEVLQGES
jgi:Spy/CpxP family protein refolding chaperone